MTMPDSLPQNQLATAYAALQQAMGEAWGWRLEARGKEKRVSPSNQPLTSSLQPQLIAVSKGQPVEKLKQALALGIRAFGENRVQEAEAKWPELKQQYPDLLLHLIGPLQSNKAAEAVALFDVIQTIDRPKIADAIAKEMARQNKTPRLLVQVNIGEEPQKAGVAPAGLADLLAHCAALGLSIEGLMCVPPAEQNPAPYFALLKKLTVRHGLTECSMGMSHDFVTGIRLGATMVRVGTALFGERN